jgi:hypothetical protein
MIAVPPEIPLTIPEPDPITAIAVLALVHVPPVTASVSVIVDPAQTLPGIVIAERLFTVTEAVAVHPDASR